VKLLIAILVTLFTLLQYSLWLGNDSLIELYGLQRSIERQRHENGGLKERNARLEAEVRDLKEGTEAVEERARRELGMVGKGETFFQIVESSPGQEAAH
jgi:cell division protein FtsB